MKITNHSYSNYQQIALNHIDLDLKISFEKQIIYGIATYKLDRKTQTNMLILDTKGILINTVSSDTDEKLKHELGKYDSVLGSALIIRLPEACNNVIIEYETTEDSEALQWLTPEQTYSKKHPFLFTQSQAILARTWIPLQDCPAVRFTYTAKVQVDMDLLPLMSASNPQEKNIERVYSYNMPQPIPSYLMALCVGDLVFKPLGDSCGVYADPEQLNAAATEFIDLQSMIDSASQLYGNYQWGRYDVVVLPPSFPFGGMENPRLTFATPTIIAGDKSLVALIAHELAHSWSGNLVTNETWEDFWLNEGFTVYFENRIMEKIYGKPYADMLAVLGMGELKTTLTDLLAENPDDTKLFLNLAGRNPDDGVTDIAYEKGRFFLLMIENVVGRENFDTFLKHYFKKKAFTTITTVEFIKILNDDLLNKNPAWKEKVNYNEWIFERGLPANCPIPNSTEFDKVAADVKAFNNNGTLPNVTQYTTHHWLQFLRALPEKMVIAKIDALDKAFNLTNSRNSEIACDWFKHAIDSKYEKAYPAMENFLLKVGRRKFLTPLYSPMVKSNQKDLAKNIFEKAKSGYHAVSNNTISELLYAQ